MKCPDCHSEALAAEGKVVTCQDCGKTTTTDDPRLWWAKVVVRTLLR